MGDQTRDQTNGQAYEPAYEQNFGQTNEPGYGQRQATVIDLPTVVPTPAVSAARIRVFLLDDHEVVRRGVRDMLETARDLVVVGEATTAAEALELVPQLRPDVAVLDVRLPDSDGVTVCRELRSQMPKLACLMLTSFADDEALVEAIMAGASGYVLKQIRGADLVSAIRTVASGQSMLDAGTTAQVMERLRTGARSADPLSSLTEQERRILDLIGEGLTNRQIGERLFLAEKTVKNYVSSLLAKLGMQRRTQAAVMVSKVHAREGSH
jgi:two-component system response regulator DevR